MDDPVASIMSVATPAAGAFAPQAWETYRESDHRTWARLYTRQRDLLEGRACDAFLRGMEALDLGESGIPDFARINAELEPLTGWTVLPVTGLVPDALFFECLANRRFPAARFIRTSEHLDYLSEPDVFHDLFGHVPMLADPMFADYMCAYGRGGLRALGLHQMSHLARLYWHTVEFGLVEDSSGLRIFGVGIASSHAESLHSLESHAPRRIAFDLERVMRTPYRIDDLQQTYFVIPAISSLLETTLQDFSALYGRLSTAADLGLDVVTAEDRLIPLASQ